MARIYHRPETNVVARPKRTAKAMRTSRTERIESESPAEYDGLGDYLNRLTRRQRQEYGDLLKVARIFCIESYERLSLVELRDAIVTSE